MTALTLAAQLQPQIAAYLDRADRRSRLGLPTHGPLTVSVLAQGEYNLNFLVTAGGRHVVARINTGTQIAEGDQIGYEFRALAFLAPFRHRPRAVSSGQRRGGDSLRPAL